VNRLLRGRSGCRVIMDTRRRLSPTEIEQSATVGPDGQGRRHGKKDKRSKLGTLWVLAERQRPGRYRKKRPGEAQRRG
jgi:hypothetical protein